MKKRRKYTNNEGEGKGNQSEGKGKETRARACDDADRSPEKRERVGRSGPRGDAI